ncbi:DUF6906 family protein [Anaerotalea alkaliphila]|uniref:DUF6906 family protein n=1 Tax=Anaerotalea alkaliphila TaxID=2662126 RepID=UPI00139133D9|nr:hypothetical protein [Anaerotalea alkaliphila]
MRNSGRRPTRKEKLQLAAHGLNPDNWMVIRHTLEMFEAVNKLSRKKRFFRLTEG